MTPSLKQLILEVATENPQYDNREICQRLGLPYPKYRMYVAKTKSVGNTEGKNADKQTQRKPKWLNLPQP